jgi:ADP-ribosylglycohydrolase
MEPSRDTVSGALFGCAVGDAMGAPFEGLWDTSIPTEKELVAGFHEYHGYPRGQFTDDTQLTLATVESIVETGCIDYQDIATRISELWLHYAVIGPGGACSHAAESFLATRDWRSMGAPVGQAGNGTAMRTAVLGLLYCDRPERLTLEVAAISRLTHTDPRSVAGGVAIAEAARCIAVDHDVAATSLCAAVAAATEPFHSPLSDYINELPSLIGSDRLMDFIAWSGQEVPEFDRPIITPYVIPTVLAALFCIISEPSSWESAVTRAIRLGGDVDTLGAIVGSLAGIRHGYSGIPSHLSGQVQMAESLRRLSARLHALIPSLSTVDCDE